MSNGNPHHLGDDPHAGPVILGVDPLLTERIWADLVVRSPHYLMTPPLLAMKGPGRRRWRALDAGTTRVFVEADAPRVGCGTHGPTVARVPWARHDVGHTRARRPDRPDYAIDLLPGLTIHVAPTEIRNQDGEVIDIIG